MDKATAADLQRLQGRWEQVRFEEDGIISPPDSHGCPGAITTIDGTSFHVRAPDGTTLLAGSFELDAATEPKSIIWIDATGEDAGKRLPAIYELSDNHFLFVAADEGKALPQVFTTRPGLTLRGFARV